MNNEITVQLDPDTGNMLITVPNELVCELGWNIETIVQWTLDQNNQSLTGNPVK